MYNICICIYIYIYICPRGGAQSLSLLLRLTIYMYLLLFPSEAREFIFPLFLQQFHNPIQFVVFSDIQCTCPRHEGQFEIYLWWHYLSIATRLTRPHLFYASGLEQLSRKSAAARRLLFAQSMWEEIFYAPPPPGYPFGDCTMC